MNEGERHGLRFWVALAVGGAIMAWGVRLYLVATPDTGRRVDFVTWMVGLDLVHDGILAPLVVLGGAGLARLVGGRWRAPVQAGLILSGAVLLVATPPLLGTARVAANPTIQPLDYVSATLTALAVAWGVVGAWSLTVRLRPPPEGGRRGRSHP